MKHTPYSVKDYLPSFVKESEDYSKFITFLDSYYEFLDQYLVDYFSTRDVQYVSDYLLKFLKNEFVGRFPDAAINERKLIRIVKDVYLRKGTQQGIELLFKIFFNEAITVRRTNDKLLRASDGKWVQEGRLACSYTGDLSELQGNITLRLINDKGIFAIDVDYLENEPETSTLYFYFKITKKLEFGVGIDGNLIEIYNNGNLEFDALLKQQTSVLRLLTGGKYWKKGQVFKVTGSEKDTIVRVVNTDAVGTITKIEIVEYGKQHPQNQGVSISPFPNRPASGVDAEIDITIAPDPGGVGSIFEIEISEQTTGSTENYNVVVSNYPANNSQYFAVPSINPQTNPVGYLAAFYTNDDYNGFLFAEATETLQEETFSIVDPTLSYEKWLESRAFFRFEYDFLLLNRGQWVTNDGRISNSTIKIQDSYYYQMFSYIITSNLDIKEYDGLMQYMNPAGLKYFGELQKSQLVTAVSELADSTYTELIINAP